MVRRKKRIRTTTEHITPVYAHVSGDMETNVKPDYIFLMIIAIIGFVGSLGALASARKWRKRLDEAKMAGRPAELACADESIARWRLAAFEREIGARLNELSKQVRTLLCMNTIALALTHAIFLILILKG